MPIPPLPELLAPAGGPAAGYAALQYGADAVYAGLKNFSARAEAENWTPSELSDFAAYAHSLAPRRRVYVAVNTLVKENELPALRRLLDRLPLARVDAVIVQDLGVLHILRRDFPDLPVHASTQLVAHNLAAAQFLAGVGVKRAVLARELTLPEIAAIAAALPQLEIEVFIHGSLCYAYSGLCLFSSHRNGRSANRGKCAYPCRDFFTVGNGSRPIFSMKDLSLADHLDELRAAGVRSLKIEGRKKSPLYVATVVDFYRRLLDGKTASADWQTVFSRETAAGFAGDPQGQAPQGQDPQGQAARGDLIDPELVGHRGAAIGTIEKIITRADSQSRDSHYLIFTPAAAIERHDGLQFAAPRSGRNRDNRRDNERLYGFGVDEMWREGGERVFVAEAGRTVAVKMPDDAPRLAMGMTVYHAASQAVKRRYPLNVPRPGAYRHLWLIKIAVKISATEIIAAAEFMLPDDALEIASPLIGFLPPTVQTQAVGATLGGEWTAAQKPENIADTWRQTFAKTAEYPYAVGALTIDNPAGLFVPVSKQNQLRRELYAKLAGELESG
ncbi:MAG: U32 family peptidase [Planctomycetota bacterium]|jgi:collagenase-like PrtC family protease|nr:U32 family peptidase [Planctomycetota bacterium]